MDGRGVLNVLQGYERRVNKDGIVSMVCSELLDLPLVYTGREDCPIKDD